MEVADSMLEMQQQRGQPDGGKASGSAAPTAARARALSSPETRGVAPSTLDDQGPTAVDDVLGEGLDNQEINPQNLNVNVPRQTLERSRARGVNPSLPQSEPKETARPSETRPTTNVDRQTEAVGPGLGGQGDPVDIEDITGIGGPTEEMKKFRGVHKVGTRFRACSSQVCQRCKPLILSPCASMRHHSWSS